MVSEINIKDPTNAYTCFCTTLICVKNIVLNDLAIQPLQTVVEKSAYVTILLRVN